MNLGNPYDQIRMEAIVLERFNFHARQTVSLHAIAPMLCEEVRIARMLDRMGLDFALTLYSSAVKGDTTHEQKHVEWSYDFPVFATWWDHLKYDLKEKRIAAWIPSRMTRNLSIRYQQVTKKRDEYVPVSVIRVCPHATFRWNDSREQRMHLAYLFPERFDAPNPNSLS